MSTESSNIRDNGLDLKDASRQKVAVIGCADGVRAIVEGKSDNSALEAETARLGCELCGRDGRDARDMRDTHAPAETVTAPLASAIVPLVHSTVPHPERPSP